MNSMLQLIADGLASNGILFDINNQRVRCLAHIINLAAKKVLDNLHALGPEEESIEEVEENEENLSNIIYKVMLLMI